MFDSNSAGPDDEFSVERDLDDRELVVKHIATGHVFKFTISADGLTLEDECRIDRNPASNIDPASFGPGARSAAARLYFPRLPLRNATEPPSRAELAGVGTSDQPLPSSAQPPSGWMAGTDDAFYQAVQETVAARRRRFIAATTSEAVTPPLTPPAFPAANPDSQAGTAPTSIGRRDGFA